MDTEDEARLAVKPEAASEDEGRKGVSLHWKRMAISMILGLAAGVAVILLFNPNVEEDIATAVTATQAPGFLVLALVALAIMLIADAWSLLVLTRIIRPDAPWWRVVGVAFEAHLVGGATSFGGIEIPYQVVVLRSVGLTVSQATSTVMVKGVIHTTVLVLAALVAFVPVAGSPITSLQRWILLGVLGFLLVGWVIGTLWVRRPLGLSLLPATIRRRVASFVDALREFRQMGWRALVKVTLAQFVYWICMFSLIPLVLLALGYRGRLVPIVVGQAVLQVLMPLSPLPGGAGVAELGYLELIGRMIPGNIRVASLIMWRVLTWLIPVALGGLAMGLRGVKRHE